MAQAKNAEGTSFDIHVVGDSTKRTWTGTFRAKATLSFRDKLNMDRMRRELLGADGAGASAEALITAGVISELSVRLTEVPEWWKETKGGLDLYDVNVLKEVYDVATGVERDHIKATVAAGAEAEGALKADGEKK